MQSILVCGSLYSIRTQRNFVFSLSGHLKNRKRVIVERYIVEFCVFQGFVKISAWLYDSPHSAIPESTMSWIMSSITGKGSLSLPVSQWHWKTLKYERSFPVRASQECYNFTKKSGENYGKSDQEINKLFNKTNVTRIVLDILLLKNNSELRKNCQSLLSIGEK